MPTRQERKAAAREAAKLLMQGERKKFRWDYTLAFVVAIMGIVIYFRPPQDLLSALFWLVIMFGLGIYPVLHFSELILPNWKVLRLAALLVWVFVVLSFGVSVSPPPAINFKASMEFTWWRKQMIVHDISNMQQYLSSLGLPKPSYVPPLSFEDDFECGASTPSAVPKYRHEIILGKKTLWDRHAVTSCYADFVVGQTLLSTGRVPILRYMWSTILFPRYFSASFWNKKPSGYPLLFWDMRDRLGKDTADKLAASTLLVIADNANPSVVATPAGEHWDSYLGEQIRIADSTIDSGCSNWPAIEEVLIKDTGLKVDELKNHDFSHYYGSNACLERWKK
jgi:hypothetical protein